MERNDISVMRARFLRKIVNLRLNNDVRSVIYFDETWVNQNHTRDYICRNSERTEGLKVPTGKGGRLIIRRAGSSSFGYIKHSKLIFRLRSGLTEDYLTQLNFVAFKD